MCVRVHMYLCLPYWEFVCVFMRVCVFNGEELTWIRLGERVSVQQVSEKQEK